MTGACESLAAALRRLPDAQLQALVASRPELLRQPPTTFEDLAFRIAHPQLVRAGLMQLDRTAVQVAALLGALGGRADAATLAEALSRTAETGEDAVAQALERGAALGLVWSSPSNEWQCVPPLTASGGALLLPFVPVWSVAQHLPMPELRAVLARLGLRSVGSRADGQALLQAHFSDEAWLRQLLTASPAGAKEFLAALLAGQPPPPGNSEGWLRARLLVVADQSGAPTLCREVAVVLLDGRVVPTVVAPPPAHGPAAVDSAEPVRAALALVEQVRALLSAVTSTPLRPLQSGGIGVKEQRRLGKLLGLDEWRVAWLLDLAGLAGLLGENFTAGQPTQETTSWLQQGEVAAYLRLAQPALRQPGPRPLLPADTVGTLPAPLAGWPAQLSLRPLDDVARASLDHGDEDELLAWLDWRWIVELPAALRRELLRERLLQLHLLGLLGAGPAPWVRALLAQDAAAAGEAFAQCLDPEQDTAVWQADTTAFVAGRPATALRDVLTAVALPESERTWRLSADRVRESLDAGRDADELLVALQRSSLHSLPTTVEQAVRDVARRHGQIRVVPATTLLRVADRAQGELLVRDRRLTTLGLTVVEDTVLASVKPVKEVLAALRKAGHAPVGPSEPDAPLLPPRPRARPWTGQQASAVDVVTRLRAHPPRSGSVPAHLALALEAEQEQPGIADALAGLHRQLTHLPATQSQRLLQAVIDAGPVEIDYVDRQGRHTTRIIEDATVEDGLIVAYCALRDDERVFAPDGVLAVREARAY